MTEPTGKTQVTNVQAQNQKKVIQTFKHQLEQLSQFVIRVTKFYEGVSPELDQELQILRGHLGGKSNFALAEASLSKLTGLLLINSDSIKQQNSKSIGLLESTVKKLQGWGNIPYDLKLDSTRFLSTLPHKHSSLYRALPQFEQAIELYQRALDNAFTFNSVVSADTTDKAKLALNEKLHQEITTELRELLEQISDGKDKSKRLAEIKSQLVKGINHQDLLECCLVVIRAFMKDLLKERKHAEQFVSGLHKSLASVNNGVERSIEATQSCFEAKQSDNVSLRENIANIDHVVTEELDLSALKEKASEYLKKMASSIDSREQSDKEEQMSLMNLLNEMRTQLTSLEQETSEYKHRLIEQKYHSHHDALTKVPNRTAYNERMEIEYRRWRRHGSSLCLAVLDVDHFKSINDNYGHAAGDKTLQVIAQNINRCLRATDFLSRWGGEEFVILFPQIPEQELLKPMETIRRHIERIPFKFKDVKVTITVSIGAAYFKEGDSIEAVFDRADKALYEAKSTGRNRCIINQG
jgi:diguanylate cyclase